MGSNREVIEDPPEVDSASEIDVQTDEQVDDTATEEVLLGEDKEAEKHLFGRVVYSGSGLIGYGQLIIVKHNKRYLSAYAHNNKILVKEGDTVRGGQRIAEMGRSGSNRAMLHFEIRKDGKPIDPIRYLPK